MAKQKKPKRTMRDKFNDDYANSTDIEIQKEILYQLLKSNSISEKTRENTSTLIIWLIVIPIIAGALIWVVTSL